MKLDPKGLEAAREQIGTNHDGIIRAYLTAITPAEVGWLVERLQHRAVSEDDAIALIDDDLAEAASLIQSQAARIAELEAGMKPFADRYDAWGDTAEGVYTYEDYTPRMVSDFARARALLNGERKG